MSLPGYDAATRERFSKYIDKSGECWTWTSGKLKGYGLFTFAGGSRRAHRIAWEMENGPIPAGLHVLHVCDNPSCVRVSHLRLGTHADNMRDAAEKGRTASGLRNYNAKLSETQVREIYEARQRGVVCPVLAEQYGVSRVAIFHIGHGRRKTLGGRSR
jgi:hypothetical protein